MQTLALSLTLTYNGVLKITILEWRVQYRCRSLNEVVIVLKTLKYIKIHKIITHASKLLRVEVAKPPLPWPTCASEIGVTYGA